MMSLLGNVGVSRNHWRCLAECGVVAHGVDYAGRVVTEKRRDVTWIGWPAEQVDPHWSREQALLVLCQLGDLEDLTHGRSLDTLGSGLGRLSLDLEPARPPRGKPDHADSHDRAAERELPRPERQRDAGQGDAGADPTEH